MVPYMYPVYTCILDAVMSSIHSQVQLWQQIEMEKVAVGMMTISGLAVGMMTATSMLQPCAVLVVAVTGN